jgi:hypothetical protein
MGDFTAARLAPVVALWNLKCESEMPSFLVFEQHEAGERGNLSKSGLSFRLGFFCLM